MFCTLQLCFLVLCANTIYDFCSELTANEGPLIKAIRGKFVRRDPKTGVENEESTKTIATWNTAAESFTAFMDRAWREVPYLNKIIL